MDKHKIEALKALGIDQATIDALLADVLATEKSAEAQHVRYKGAAQTRELAIANGLSTAVDLIENTIWADYANGKFGAALERVGAIAVALKAAGDPQQAPELQTALQAAIEAVGADQVIVELKRVAAGSTGSARSTVSDSGRQSAQTKAYDPRRDPMALAFGADQIVKGRRA